MTRETRKALQDFIRNSQAQMSMEMLQSIIATICQEILDRD